jgi:DMSO reductase anchor subunit
VPVDIGSSLKVEELEKQEGPRMDFSLFEDNPIPEEKIPRSSSRITAAGEWPLLVFSLLNAFLVGFYAYGALSTTSTSENFLVLAGGLLSAIFSLSHLGRKGRAWRSLANLRHSWLSREILFLLLFYLSVIIDLLLIPLPKIFPLALGALLLISIDSLYSLAFWKWKLKIHSSQTLFLALSLYFLLQDFLTVFMVLSILRMGLYIIRNSQSGDLSRAHILLKSFRVLALTAAILVLYSTGNVWISTLCFLLGEVVDRIEFYNELNVPEPGSILAAASHRVT